MMNRRKGIFRASDKLTKEETNMNLEDFSIEEIEAFMQTEDYEQLDELSKKTLGSYVKKADKHAGELDKVSDAHTDKAIKAGQSTPTGWKHRDAAAKASSKALERSKGVDKATKRLTKEDADFDLEDFSIEEIEAFMQTEDYEQLDEISKKTLGSYIKKASHDVATKSAIVRQFSNDAQKAKEDQKWTEQRKKNDMSDKAFNKSWNRRKGMAKAVDRLTKESYESLGLLVQAIQEGNASDISTLFSKLMADKVTALVEERKVEIAESLFESNEAELNLEDFSVEEIEDFMQTEDYEQLDELSKKTLASYAKKASDSATQHAYEGGRKIGKSGSGFHLVRKTLKNLSKEAMALKKQSIV